MSIDINLANSQAAQLRSYADQLRSAKNDLYKYKDTIVSAWRGAEARGIIASIDAQTARIDRVIAELESLSSNVQSTAASIKKQEDAAAAAAKAKAEKQNRINAAQKNYNQALEEKDRLEQEQRDVASKITKTSLLKSAPLLARFSELVNLIEQAQKRVEEALKALNNAKR